MRGGIPKHGWVDVQEETHVSTYSLIRILCHRIIRKANSYPARGILVALILLPLAFLGIGWTKSSALPQIEGSVTGPFNICPIQSCQGYPLPSKVRGITIAALENWLVYDKSVRAQIRAARGWGANTVRLQILQDKLVGAQGDSFSPGYMANIEDITNYALQHGLTVVLNAQTEISTGFPWNENLPTHATVSFWRYLTQEYGKNKNVIFDLFNEPRYCSWAQWQESFQHLVQDVRGFGSQNQFWIEGRWWGATLQGVPLLHGQGIVYSFHHPGSPWPWQTPVGPSTWNSAFGNIANEGVPVVNGEFVNFMGGYYWPRSTYMVSEYLRYLSAHHIGTVAWSLQPGIMTATGNMSTAVSEPQGAGRMLWRYFHGWIPDAAPSRTEHVRFRFDRGFKYE